MNNENLALWSQVEKTDARFTKKATISKNTITSIDPQYQKKRATEIFGPYGIGWGIVPETENHSEKTYQNGTEILTYKATLFYKFNGERGEIPIGAQIQSAYVTKQGKGYLLIDSEALKKVRTNAITKGLSELGFNADVFLGLYDDHQYVQQRMLESNNALQLDYEEGVITAIQKIEKETDNKCSILKTSENITTLNMVYKSNQNQITRECAEAKTKADKYLQQLQETYKETKAKLEGKK